MERPQAVYKGKYFRGYQRTLFMLANHSLITVCKSTLQLWPPFIRISVAYFPCENAGGFTIYICSKRFGKFTQDNLVLAAFDIWAKLISNCDQLPDTCKWLAEVCHNMTLAHTQHSDTFELWGAVCTKIQYICDIYKWRVTFINDEWHL